MERIYQKIYEQQSTFSKNLQKISAHFYDDPKTFAIYSAAEAAKVIGVSETTVIRFCQKLNYKGYSALQKEVQHHLFQKSSLSDYVEAKAVDDKTSEPIKSLMEHDRHSIQKVMEQIPEMHLEKTVKKLANSDHVLIAGARSSHALASWFAFSLDLIVGNTRFYQPNVDDVLLRISELTEQSVFVAFSFHRYAADTIHIAKLAKQRGAFVITFTDSPISPITNHASLVLPLQLNVKSTLDAAPAILSLTNSITSAVSLAKPDQFQKRAKLFDSIDGQDFFA
ncbi:DNA-binding MurR/RpiR family transcriptional regulator [Virgibacillus natechei]|uniref:DNA-binding MurR/RpiR family transcriptional regulator n=1 Tax=Virgibacillus natechei TaxID=1216297 RepID=A0ABS4IKB5_9BACI|nr:MurR/RpiR family transcriptional regulator [Virgibacillus natechei]MBP1970776.1 DNA-binding MurR/RpiR family transcriptional regulator [Virgibacillus natechei]UZD12322.1 MurR/RpiR family transcriptional regulator [Virgibacillus natechei]